MRAISLDNLNRVKSLLETPKSIRSIASESGLSRSYVQQVAKKYFPDRKFRRAGRPKKLSGAAARYCVRKVTKDQMDSAVSVKKALQKDCGVTVCDETVRCVLKSSGLGAIEKEKKPHITPANAKKRLDWCKRHRDWTVADWSRVIWTDETKVNWFSSDGRQWAWIRDSELRKPHHVKPTRKHGGGGIMLWSAISYAGVGWLCKIDGTMDKELYKSILEDELELSIDYMCKELKLKRNQVWFQQDNDPKHKARSVTKYLLEQDYQILDWPPQSPDLNPIENMWSTLKRQLNTFTTPPSGMLDLFERVQEVWYHQISAKHCQNVINSMPERIQQCIEAKGYWTDY